jgi:hypothetical protein
MAQPGDTITYTYSDGTAVSEDVSSVEELVIDYIDGANDGGKVENVTVDVSGESTLYIWVANNATDGRYEGGDGNSPGGGSSEVSLSPKAQGDTSDAPFLAGAGGGGGTSGDGANGGGARGGIGTNGGADAKGVAPPAGGDGLEAGYGAIASNRSIVSGGSTTQGGGSPAGDGEIQISYKQTIFPPTNVQITDAATEGQLTLDWDEDANAAGYYVYRAESSGSTKSDYTQVADVSSPPYTDTGLEDGERYYYRVSSHD